MSLGAEAPLQFPGPPQPLRQAHDDTTASNCSWGGSLSAPTTQLLYSREPAIACPPRCRSYRTGESGSLAPPQPLRQAHGDTAASNCSPVDPYETTHMPVSSCLQGDPSGSSGRGGITTAPWPTSAVMTGHDDTAASTCSRGGSLSRPDDDDALSSSSSAPVLEEARNCGSSQTQELLHDWRRRVYPYPWVTHARDDNATTTTA
jgi:hypothetical protein